MPSAITLTLCDQTFAGKTLRETPVSFESERVTVQDIIEARVRQEVEDYNKRLPDFYNGLVEPSDAEQTLEGYKVPGKRAIDAEKQVYVALDAFQKNGYFLLIDSIQSESLEQEVNLQPDTRISFIKLTPLVGG